MMTTSEMVRSYMVLKYLLWCVNHPLWFQQVDSVPLDHGTRNFGFGNWRELVGTLVVLKDVVLLERESGLL